jgi:hypothetical protein
LPGGILLLELCLLCVGTVPLAVFYLRAQRAAGRRGDTPGAVRDALLAMAMGAGLAPSNTVAALAGLRRGAWAFERTPKRGASSRHALAGPRRTRHRFYRGAGARFVWLELVLLIYLTATRLVPSSTTRFGELPFLAFFAVGLSALAVRSVHDAWRTPFRFPTRAAPPAAAP